MRPVEFTVELENIVDGAHPECPGAGWGETASGRQRAHLGECWFDQMMPGVLADMWHL